MAHKISDETIEYVGILANRIVGPGEGRRRPYEKMLDYIDTLNESRHGR